VGLEFWTFIPTIKLCSWSSSTNSYHKLIFLGSIWFGPNIIAQGNSRGRKREDPFGGEMWLVCLRTIKAFLQWLLLMGLRFYSGKIAGME
jgi:hypothetical protein